MDQKGIDYLRAKLAEKRRRVLTRYSFYEMKNAVRDFQISTPPNLSWVKGSLGWCAKSVDSLADRLSFNGFHEDVANLEEIFQMNNPDVMFDAAILSALISSCSFVYCSAGEDGFPRLQVIGGANATGIMDEITGMLKEGYAVLDRDEHGQPKLEAHFLPGNTTYYKNGLKLYDINTNVPYPCLVPIVHSPDDNRPFGHSRITRACMSLQESALRTIKRSEISAEFYSYPQKYITGVAQDSELMESWKATMSAMMIFEKDDDGDHPVVGQFQTQSQTPHLEQLKLFAAMFAGETGLTVDDLGFASGNPASADAIKASHENLRLAARKAQRSFGSGFLNVGIVAACIRDGVPYERKAFYRTTPCWNPIFEADASSLGGIGDAIIKIQQAYPNYITEDKLRELTGL